MRGGEASGQSILEYSVVLAVVCAVIAGGAHLYAKRALQGRFKAGADTLGDQFSARWSDRAVTTTTHQRAQLRLTNEGESTTTFLDHATSSSSGFTDRFSDKKLTEEKLTE